MNKIRVGVTGQNGFIGKHLYSLLNLFPSEFECIPFNSSFFHDSDDLGNFLRQCDVVVHLAAVNRDEDEQNLYKMNTRLVELIIASLKKEGVKPHVVFASSTQEELNNLYGKSKKVGRFLFADWARKVDASFSGLIIPNVFGTCCRPNYNSFIATFSYKLTHEELPVIINDSSVRLIYVGNLCNQIIDIIKKESLSSKRVLEDVIIPFDFEKKVSEVYSLLSKYKKEYFDQGIIPALEDRNEVNLFNTFRSYIDITDYFPRKLVLNTDYRGSFVETIRLGIGGQVSFSTTKSDITRGNHFHIRKIERFIVINGKALIKLRMIGTNKVIDLYLDGKNPSYVDIPIWMTHSIRNIGMEDLYTQFWISEWYDPADPDTYMEKVEINGY